MEPTIRFLKVRGAGRDTGYVSRINLEGMWLTNCGFTWGDKITVNIQRRRLVITPRKKNDEIVINRKALNLTDIKLVDGDIVYPYFGERGVVKKEIIKATIEGKHYRVTNIPYRAPGIALNDLIEAERELGYLFFKRIVQKSGNNTIHLQLWDKYWEKPLLMYLESLGCAWICRVSRRITINIPPSASLKEIVDFLDNSRGTHTWEYQLVE